MAKNSKKNKKEKSINKIEPEIAMDSSIKNKSHSNHRNNSPSNNNIIKRGNIWKKCLLMY